LAIEAKNMGRIRVMYLFSKGTLQKVLDSKSLE